MSLIHSVTTLPCRISAKKSHKLSMFLYRDSGLIFLSFDIVLVCPPQLKAGLGLLILPIRNEKRFGDRGQELISPTPPLIPGNNYFKQPLFIIVILLGPRSCERRVGTVDF